MADPYTTYLTPDQEAEYNQWRSSLPKNLQNDADYDLRGAFLQSVKADGRAHMTDKFKKPNHITFSSESQYSGALSQGGKWVDDGRGGYVFWASPTNLEYNQPSALASYFKQYEKGNTVVLPIDYRLPRGGRQ